ncbi:MAG: DUF4129 domain-containing protein [Thiotrichaceae bacterium]|nr:DUF4129 domain-containing protein [Thiotrichaceae bacterium]
MQIERLAVVVRPRNPWEAMDLGVRMVQQWAKPLYRVWLLVFFLIILLSVAATWGSIAFTPWLIWWLKPLYDRVLLYFLSHAVFGEYPSVGQTFRALPSLWLNFPSLNALLFGRFDSTRSFTLPVTQLEGLRGKARRERLSVLKRKVASPAQTLTTIGIHLEGVIYLSGFALLYFMLPQHSMEQQWLFSWLGVPESDLMNAVSLGLYCIAVAILEPFYVACGFALYLNRRTQLEAWDIELDFRRLSKRLQQAGFGILVLCVLGVTSFSLLPQSLHAAEIKPQQTADQIKVEINHIMQHPEFSRHETISEWREKSVESDKTADNIDQGEYSAEWLKHWLRMQTWRDMLGSFAEVIRLLLWLILLGVFLYFVPRWLLARIPKLKTSTAAPEELSVFFFDEEGKIDFPKDIPQQVWARWNAGQHRPALSLLYRGALYHLQQEQGLAISRSMTEAECLSLVKKLPDLYSYLSQIVSIWQRFAYAHQSPQGDDVEQLCAAWTEHFKYA